MRIPSFSKTRMLTPTAGERLTRHPAVVILCFLLVMLLAEEGKTLFLSAGTQLLSHSLDRNVVLLLSLFATIVTVGAVLLYCLVGERRSLLSLGFSGRGIITEYAGGLAGGLLLFGLPVLLCVLTGTLTLSASLPPWGLILLFLVGFLIQGLSEELLCRSYLMVSLSRGLPLWACVTVNALLFSLLHIGNPNVSPLALINILLFGLFASLLTLRRGSIWMAAGLHSIWNFSQGNLFGIPVSGLGGLPSPLTAQVADGRWQHLVNGGSFGLEGGLAVTLALALACGVVLCMPTREAEISPSDN
ncbi:MAG: CPBP family intramembrane metalloprotease [Clostridia bacterium]|nr:CPBP family intramembrane metalloprotease [Clostridia bacterium]